ncbi:MAG: hypothetical protein V4641_31250 [Pseudomonadota bacterium]
MTTPIDHENAVKLAVMETEMGHMKAAFLDLKFTNDRQTQKIDLILSAMSEAKGGWKTLMMIGGAAGTAGGFITWVLSHWKG